MIDDPARRARALLRSLFCAAGILGAAGGVASAQAPAVPGMPPVIGQSIYSEDAPGKLVPEAAEDPVRVYVPNLRSNDVYVIDPATFRVIDKFPVGIEPQHVVPSWNLKTLWVTNNAEGRRDGSVTPIDPHTGRPGKALAVDDPYNMYFTPDGKSAIIVAEARGRLDFRDPHTMALQASLSVPGCRGINHADYSRNGGYAIFSCEFNGRIVKIDTIHRKILGTMKLSHGHMPQDVCAAPDGRTFFIADLRADGVFVVDGDSFKEIGFIHTGVGAHGCTPSRDGTKLYITNRGSHAIHGPRHSKAGGIAVIDFASRKVSAVWPIPGGGSPDMGMISADGRTLWVSGRFDDVVYVMDLTDGKLTHTIPVGAEPHGLTIWPQPGRYSLGHTGHMR